MTPTAVTTLITDNITVFGTQAFVILTAFVLLGISFIGFYFGWNKLRRLAGF